MCSACTKVTQMSEVQILKEGVLLKMSQQKKKISPRNYKERLFILTSNKLMYYEQEKGKKKRKKGSILTERIFCVEKVEPEKNAPVERTFPVQIVHDESILYVFAKDDTNRSDWLKELLRVIQGNDKLATKYHKGLWVDGVFQCCGQAVKNASGCCDWHKESSKLRAYGRNLALLSGPSAKFRERTQLPPIPEDEGSAGVQVVAMYHYTARKPEELSLVKGNQYVALERMSDDWWKIRDTTGYKITILSAGNQKSIMLHVE